MSTIYVFIFMCRVCQWQVLMQQQQKQIDEAIEKAQNETVLKQAEENNIRLADFDAILQPIIDSCTKDSISAGKTHLISIDLEFFFTVFLVFNQTKKK